jgi:hypothetical protein
MRIEYSAWHSSVWDRRKLAEGALFSGLTRDVPVMFKHLLDRGEKRQYCTIWPQPKEADE